jgi:tRNA threonylcarbamoyladenosine biosynthesis protein TsaE
MSSDHHTFALADTTATEAFGARLAALLTPGMRVYLQGDLGAGKTTLTRGLLRALGHTGPVKSPTYTLVEIYVFSGYILYHFDFYRFSSPEEWLDAGLDEHFNETSVCLVEWPDKAGGLLPPADLELRFDFVTSSTGDSRTVHVKALSEHGKTCLQALTAPTATPPAST